MNNLKDNLLNPSHWIRLIFVIIYAVVMYMLFFPILLLLVVLQFICALIIGEPNNNLAKASNIFGQYILQTINYITYNSDDKPWPFNDINTDIDRDFD